jgi:pyrrolidone-carboxylate peptidase
MYNNSSWDLVDGLAQGKVKLEDVKVEQLPQEMRNMDKEKQRIYVKQKFDERKKVKEEIGRLSKARNEYVKKQKLMAPQLSVNTIEEALTSAVRKQGQKKDYKFKAN